MSARILLIDDDEGFLYFAKKALARANLDVIESSGYLHALQTLESLQSIDLLVTDLFMPKGVNGFALARMAKLRRPHIKLLYVTAFDVSEDEADGQILRKPLSEEDLVREVRIALGESSI